MIKKDEIKKVVKGDKVMKNVEKKLLDLSEDEELVGAYDIELYNRKVRNSKIRYGIKKGIEEELEKVKKETINQSKIEIAKKMLDEKLDIDLISKTTGLSIKEIENI